MLQGITALSQAPACCSSSRAGELTSAKPPGEVSKAGCLPTSRLLPHPYLPPSTQSPLPKMEADHLDASRCDVTFCPPWMQAHTAGILPLGCAHPCEPRGGQVRCWLRRARLSPRHCSGDRDSPKRAPPLPARALAGSRRMKGPCGRGWVHIAPGAGGSRGRGGWKGWRMTFS